MHKEISNCAETKFAARSIRTCSQIEALAIPMLKKVLTIPLTPLRMRPHFGRREAQCILIWAVAGLSG